MADSPGSRDSRGSQILNSMQSTPGMTAFEPDSRDRTILRRLWKSWLESPDDNTPIPQIIYDALRWPQCPYRTVLLYGDCHGWIRTYDDKKTKFLMKERDILVICERCGRLYRQDMSEVDRNGIIPRLPTFHLSFAFCPANINGSCFGHEDVDWVVRRERINIYYDKAARRTMNTLRNNDLTKVMRSLFGLGGWHELPFEVQLMSAYKALRITWIRSFSAYEQEHRINLEPGGPKPAASLVPNVPEAAETSCRFSTALGVMERGNKQVDLGAVWSHLKHGQLSIWGDVRYDLNLFTDGHVKESELISVYGMKREALEFLRCRDWCHEIEYLNAYAGMRHLVDGDHYFLMRTACQRASTAMDRVLDACAAGYAFKPGCEKLYALSGMRFQELFSSMCADLNALRGNARAVEKPLDARWWKSRTKIVEGKRVEVAYVYKASDTFENK